jgi:hypothetical protein
LLVVVTFIPSFLTTKEFKSSLTLIL